LPPGERADSAAAAADCGTHPGAPRPSPPGDRISLWMHLAVLGDRGRRGARPGQLL